MRTTLRTLALSAAALTTATTVPAASANAGGSSGWQPSSTPPFHLAAGESCDFELQADVLYNSELTRITEQYPAHGTGIDDGDRRHG